MTQNRRVVPPKAGAMIEALRGLGYSTPTALADIIDNSISAGADEVRVSFHWEGSGSWISVLDNGCGMNDGTLENAMRLGDRHPLEKRETSDLGRFGLGLKTASFSQCRVLTVASRMAVGHVSCLRWDLDEIEASPDDLWLLFEGPRSGSEQHLAALSRERAGTLVLWEGMDRIVTIGYSADAFLDLADQVRRHLGMVFHRLLEGVSPKFRLFVNDRPVRSWDPFLTGHPSKPWQSPFATTIGPAGTIEVQCHVLPHRDMLTEAEFDAAGGPDGWTSQQGLYIYRNHRLLIAGGWLGLGQGRAWNREESYRLARIRIDIPNTADAEWKIDIRKSTARIPATLRPWLTRLAEDTRERARRVFAYRGTPSPSASGAPLDQAWKVHQLKGGIRYGIDRRSPTVAAVLDAAGHIQPLIMAMLRVLEETVPVQRIWLDTAENKDTPRTGFAGEPSENVTSVLRVLYDDMVSRQELQPALAKTRLKSTEPFNRYPHLVDAL